MDQTRPRCKMSLELLPRARGLLLLSKGGSRLASMFGMRGVGANVNEEKLVRDDESMSQSSDTKRDPYATIEKDKVVEEQESILREKIVLVHNLLDIT